MRSALVVTVIASPLLAASAIAQAPDGEMLFTQHCATCHANPAPDTDIPNRAAMGALGPNAIVLSLTEGNMRIQGQPLSQAERVAVAERIAGRPGSPRSERTGRRALQRELAARSLTAGSVWNGWGPDTHNTRFQRDSGGITAANVANLKLKWAFGAPNATQSRSQPAIVGGKLFMASQSGMIYALDPKTGCTYWTFKAEAGVRTAISVGPVKPSGYAHVFRRRASARVWRRRGDRQAALGDESRRSSGRARDRRADAVRRPSLRPLSGVSEETAASMPDYECCKFRGSITALDASTGAVVWKTYTVDVPQPRGKSRPASSSGARPARRSGARRRSTRSAG